jgi:hypothetical protein
LCLLRPARHRAGDLRAGLLGPFLSGNMSRANFSTLLRAGANFSKSRNYVSTFPAADTKRHERTAEMNLVHLEGIREPRATAHRRFERGEGKLKAVIYLAIFLLMIYSAVKIVPIYVSDYQLSDKMQEQARFAVVNRYTEEQIRDNVFKVVQELEIPAKRDVIKVFNTNAVVKISMEYTVPLDLFFYHTDLHFSPASENKALF